jgi:hypothetical protein
VPPPALDKTPRSLHRPAPGYADLKLEEVLRAKSLKRTTPRTGASVAATRRVNDRMSGRLLQEGGVLVLRIDA